MEVNFTFWKNKKVFLTGHTGFKGGWLALWLSRMGAKVAGFSNIVPTQPSFFELLNLEKEINSHFGDIRNLESLETVLKEEDPEIVFHLAAQSLVGPSYRAPLETFSTNVMGTANVCEAVRKTPSVKALIVITTDKCYENREWAWGYRESDQLGGNDPYSASKACAELVTTCYRRSFFPGSAVAVATARAGNVIGGGDWAEARLIPDVIRAISSRQSMVIRRPLASRPWQFILEPICGYLLLAEKLLDKPEEFAEAWNFGPSDSSIQSVSHVLSLFEKYWEKPLSIIQQKDDLFHETNILKLDSSKARALLGWRPLLSLDKAVDWTARWYKCWLIGRDMREITFSQLDRYEKALEHAF